MELQEFGKTFFTNEICEKLNFKKVNTIRTRLPRVGENPKYFMTNEELNKMYDDGKIAYKFEVFGGQYGYLKDEIFSKDNMVFEMHYTTIYDWKKVRPDLKTIYIMPTDLELAKEQTKKRNLSKEKEIERLDEIDEHYNNIMNDENLRNQFDYFFYNNYDEESEVKFLKLVSEIMENNK